MEKSVFWCHNCLTRVLFEWDEVKMVWVHDCPTIKQKVERKVSGWSMKPRDKYFKKKEVEQ